MFWMIYWIVRSGVYAPVAYVGRGQLAAEIDGGIL